MFWPCETRTSICRNLATISSGLYRFLAITVLLDVKDIPQVGPLQWGWITWAPLGEPVGAVVVCWGVWQAQAAARPPPTGSANSGTATPGGRTSVCDHVSRSA